MGISGNQFDAVGLDRSVHQRLDPLIESGDEAKSQFWHRFPRRLHWAADEFLQATPELGFVFWS
jgi:hypothetical protein